MEHGMNCPHHADKDEACTCALTERTMQAAWRKRAEEAEARIAALESQVKALTEERDQARREHADAQHRYTVAMHDISTACAGTAARSACEVVELWRKERDAQAEAVRVLMAAAHPNSSGRVVCSSDLTTHQIAEAQSRGRWFVLDGGIGFALVPWKLTTDKDRAREHGWDNITPALPMAYTEDNPIARAAVKA